MKRTFGQIFGLAALALGIFCHLPHAARGANPPHPRIRVRFDADACSFLQKSLSARAGTSLNDQDAPPPNPRQDPSETTFVSRLCGNVFNRFADYLPLDSLKALRALETQHADVIFEHLNRVATFSFDCAQIPDLEGLKGLMEKGCYVTKVQHVNLSGVVAPENAGTVYGLLQQFPALQTLTLEGLSFLCQEMTTCLSTLQQENRCPRVCLSRENLYRALKNLSLIKSWTWLTSLDLACTQITDAALEYLVGLTTLTSLNLAYNQITDAAPLSALANLTELELAYTRITNTAPLSALTNLTSLGIGETQDIGAANLVGLRALTNLTHLNLSGAWITEAEVANLRGLTALTALNLRDTRITDEGLAHLSGFINLTTLKLAENWITDEGLRHLRGLKALTTLDLHQTQVTEQGKANLKQHLPNVYIKLSR